MALAAAVTVTVSQFAVTEPAAAQSPACIKVLAAVSNHLKINPTFAKGKLAGACKISRDVTWDATRGYLNSYVALAKVHTKPSPPWARECPKMVFASLKALKVAPAIADPKNATGLCTAAKGKPTLANGLYQVLLNSPHGCRSIVQNVSGQLKVNPKIGTKAKVDGACKARANNSGQASREYLKKYVIVSKLRLQRPPTWAKNCSTMVMSALKTLRIDPAVATTTAAGAACKATFGKPELAAANLLDKALMTEAEKKQMQARRTACAKVVATAAKGLRANPSFLKPVNLFAACSSAGDQPLLAARNFLNRIFANVKLP